MKVRWTSQWQLRCTSCDETRPLAQRGGLRITAASLHKYTVMWCRTCCRPRLVAVEPLPPNSLVTEADPQPSDREIEAEA